MTRLIRKSNSLYSWQASASSFLYHGFSIKFLKMFPPAHLLCHLGLSSCSFLSLGLLSQCYFLTTQVLCVTDIRMHLLCAPSVLTLSSDDCLLPVSSSSQIQRVQLVGLLFSLIVLAKFSSDLDSVSRGAFLGLTSLCCMSLCLFPMQSSLPFT